MSSELLRLPLSRDSTLIFLTFRTAPTPVLPSLHVMVFCV